MDPRSTPQCIPSSADRPVGGSTGSTRPKGVAASVDNAPCQVSEPKPTEWLRAPANGSHPAAACERFPEGKRGEARGSRSFYGRRCECDTSLFATRSAQHRCPERWCWWRCCRRHLATTDMFYTAVMHGGASTPTPMQKIIAQAVGPRNWSRCYSIGLPAAGDLALPLIACALQHHVRIA